MDPSPAPHIPRAAKVLSIRELVRLIASFNTVIDRVGPDMACGSDRKDLVQFSQVCRQTFETLTPAIWESVNGAENLLKLIDSTSMVYNDTTGKLQKITLPDQSTDRTFERFDFYAPYVKNLMIYGKNRIAFSVQGWPTLATRPHNHPLLPHLKTIMFLRIPPPAYEHDEARWISCFATAATVNVVTAFSKWGPGRFPYAAASNFLRTLIDHCPNVKHLGLHPHDANQDGGVDSLNPGFDEASASPWYQHLSSLPNLRFLSVSEGWLCPPSLQALGRIPGLDTLEIRPGSCKGFDVIGDLHLNSDLSSDAFPALVTLLLGDNCPLTNIKILGVQGIVRHLTCLCIDLGPEWGGGEWDGSWAGPGLMSSLRNIPHLRYLTIELHLTATDPVYRIKSPEALDIMAELPLRTIRLANLRLGSGAFGFNLGVIWSNVYKLSMPHQYASLQELWYFANLPRLEELTLRLDLTSTYAPAQLSHLPRVRLCVLEASLGSRINADLNVINHNAETIAWFWPGTRFIREEYQPQFEGQFEGWNSFAPLFDHLIGLYTILHASETQEEKERIQTVQKDIDADWKCLTEGAFIPQRVYVYGGRHLYFDHRGHRLDDDAPLI